MIKPNVGVVIGHFDQPDFLELNIRLIREHCGLCPILIADDCSDGSEPTPKPYSVAGRLLQFAQLGAQVHLWPNAQRIGHAGGDLSAFWKGIIWARHHRIDVLAKLSQRLLIDIPDWLDDWAAKLIESNLAVAGRGCSAHGWKVRTEAMLLRVEAWYQPGILAHFTPRRIDTPTEHVVWDAIQQSFGGEMLDWSILSPARPQPVPGIYFREANTAADYAIVARRFGLVSSFETREHKHLPRYNLG